MEVGNPVIENPDRKHRSLSRLPVTCQQALRQEIPHLRFTTLTWVLWQAGTPTQYGTFLDWRTRPSRDLAQRINIPVPPRIMDLGCGPGNSTAVCAERWPAASIVGLDSSPEMIASARASQPDRCWMIGDIGKWALQPPKPGEQVDLIFSSAALQWIDDHATVFPRLIEKLSPGGVLAAQMPEYDAIPNRLMREMAASPQWRRWFPDGQAKEWRSHPLEFYYEILARIARWLDLWATTICRSCPTLMELWTGTKARACGHIWTASRMTDSV
jgi:trans-aconitate 2-methyltransferase